MEKKSTSFSIKQWSVADRPREKLLKKGTVALTDAELIAILIGSGNKEESAVTLSQRILKASQNNLNQLSKLSIAQLMQFKGVGEAKAITIAAALELGRRRRLEEALQEQKITSSATAYAIMQPIIGELTHEEFWIIYLNTANKVLQKVQLSKGGITSTVADTRLVLKYALEFGAVGIIVAHNHPSGMVQPSIEDKQLTQKLKNACEAIDIKLLDHIIVAEKMYFSFIDEGLL